jgi:hypothetical protein
LKPGEAAQEVSGSIPRGMIFSRSQTSGLRPGSNRTGAEAPSVQTEVQVDRGSGDGSLSQAKGRLRKSFGRVLTSGHRIQSSE